MGGQGWGSRMRKLFNWAKAKLAKGNGTWTTEFAVVSDADLRTSNLGLDPDGLPAGPGQAADYKDQVREDSNCISQRADQLRP